MKLLAKFSLIFALVFSLGLASVGYLSYTLLEHNSRKQVRYQAQLMMDGAAAIRHYTTDQVRPAMNAEVSRDGAFRPPTVPAFAATEVFNHLRETYPDYSYKEATLNPTNLRDRAVDWEADVIRVFRDRSGPDSVPIFGERTTPTGTSVFLAKPLRASKACLECHSTPDAAPPAMLKLYGTVNGFGWKENEVIGAQIVSVPAALSEQMAIGVFHQFIMGLAIVGVVMLVVLNIMLFYTVIRPARQLAASADRISRGSLDEPELPVKGRDEIAVLATAFNRLHRSLASAMRMLEGK